MRLRVIVVPGYAYYTTTNHYVAILNRFDYH